MKRLSVDIEVSRCSDEYQGNPTFRVLMLVGVMRALAMAMGVITILAAGTGGSSGRVWLVLLGFALAALACVPVHVVERDA